MLFFDDHSFRPYRAWAVFFILLLFRPPSPTSAAPPNPSGELAARLLEMADRHGGLAAHVGCGDGRLAIALHRQGNLVVHGLALAPETLAEARSRARQTECPGHVSFALLSGSQLPYSDGILDLVILEQKTGISNREAMRVLAPKGTLLTRTPLGWKKEIKPQG